MRSRLAGKWFVAFLPAVLAVNGGPASAAQSSDEWRSCSRAVGASAARSAGLARALNRDRGLRRVFPDIAPSTVYRRPTTSLCADFDGDGDTDRALHYQCCTVSSPAPWLVLRRRGRAWTIAYARLHDTTFRLEGDGAALVTTEPKYARTDANCCPSRLRIGTLRWTGRAFRRVFRIEDT